MSASQDRQRATQIWKEGEKVETSKKVLTIPNLLSLFRLLLAGLFVWVYRREGLTDGRPWLLAILVVSAVTDMLDGRIARKFHMISDLGKILDPIADKVTQGVLILCLLFEYRLMRPILILFIIKELYMAIAGARVLMKTHRNEGAKWYGKVSTAVTYVVMILLFLIPDLTLTAANILIGISGICMLLSLSMYIRLYHSLGKK